RDQIDSPAFGYASSSQLAGLYAAQATQQVGDLPGHIHGGLTTLVPGAQVADPFRTLSLWEANTGGSATPVAFTSLDGAQLRGHVFMPPKSVSEPTNGYPGVVITDGSVQGYENLYYWAAEGLAQAGYMVMTYDVQGQGDSDLLPSNCTPSAAEIQSGSLCTGVPYQQNYNFYQGAEDSLDFFLSNASSPFGGSYNPDAAQLNPDEVGIAGHSLGAAAVSEVGQCDKRVKTIVAWDDLSAISGCAGVTIPAGDRSSAQLHAPALALTNDYLFNPEPQTSVPDPHAKDAGYLQLKTAGIDTEEVALRGATHLTYTYVPYVLPASELAERMAFYYTLAWLDQYLKGDPSGYTRLTATTFDNSADVSSIGAGTYSSAAALAQPTNPTAGNVPYTIAGIPVADAVSFYYESEFALHNPVTGSSTICLDMRAGCPATAPPTP
ncbi:MAG: alpha/beta hydrolase family protein, partial [Acidimicrobiales bacterium]